MIGSGTLAPPFEALDHQRRLRAVPTGRWMILWWYPKALTAGCSSCGEAFRSLEANFAGAECDVLGVSYDSPDENRAFVERYGFGFPLLTATPEIAELYGARRPDEDEWAGLPRRVSYLIDPSGVVRVAYAVTDPMMHPSRVLADLARLRGAERAMPEPRRGWRRFVPGLV